MSQCHSCRLFYNIAKTNVFDLLRFLVESVYCIILKRCFNEKWTAVIKGIHFEALDELVKNPTPPTLHILSTYRIPTCFNTLWTHFNTRMCALPSLADQRSTYVIMSLSSPGIFEFLSRTFPALYGTVSSNSFRFLDNLEFTTNSNFGAFDPFDVVKLHILDISCGQLCYL